MAAWNIVTEEDRNAPRHCCFTAYDEDDAAKDRRLTGSGATREEAIADLLVTLESAGEITRDECQEALEVFTEAFTKRYLDPDRLREDREVV